MSAGQPPPWHGLAVDRPILHRFLRALAELPPEARAELVATCREDAQTADPLTAEVLGSLGELILELDVAVVRYIVGPMDEDEP